MLAVSSLASGFKFLQVCHTCIRTYLPTRVVESVLVYTLYRYCCTDAESNIFYFKGDRIGNFTLTKKPYSFFSSYLANALCLQL